jgi:hypothetical protein
MSTWKITDHAVDRMIERARPDMLAESARAMLEVAVHDAHRLRWKTPSGETQYRLRSTKCIAVVDEPSARNGGSRVVVSVLGVTQNGQPTGVAVEHVADDDPAWDTLRREVSEELRAYLVRMATAKKSNEELIAMVPRE